MNSSNSSIRSGNSAGGAVTFQATADLRNNEAGTGGSGQGGGLWSKYGLATTGDARYTSNVAAGIRDQYRNGAGNSNFVDL